MNVDLLQKKLIAAARAGAPDGRVPFAFEKRIMALIIARTVGEEMARRVGIWWRAALSCAAVALLLGLWMWLNPTPRNDDLSQNFEATLLASVDQSDQAQ
ncbi:MAG TPA: hypothetical protein VFB55_05795 [Verrucomicrobiae bacterium]|nr:hypothetical protein [Verrucomicrobiae bacterium]